MYVSFGMRLGLCVKDMDAFCDDTILPFFLYVCVYSLQGNKNAALWNYIACGGASMSELVS